MALSKLVFKPGIVRDQTNYATEGGWYDCDKIRFRSGFPEKIGGWTVRTFTPYSGAARAIYPWATNAGTTLVSIATNEKIYISAGTELNDVTPIRITINTPESDNCLETVSGEAYIIVNLIGSNAVTGDYVTISGAVDVGGIPASEINKEHRVYETTTDQFKIAVTTAATSTISAGGGTAIAVALQISVGFETVIEGFGFGTGPFSRGTWGSSYVGSGIFLPARLIFQENFNNDLIFNIKGGDIFLWQYNLNTFDRAVYLKDVAGAVATPREVTKVLFASTGHLFALGCTSFDANNAVNDYLGTFDPMLVRWANVDSYIGPEPENWRPEVANTAGFFRLETGSYIVTGIKTRQEVLVWTDTALTSIQFLGTEEVFGRQEISANISILSPNAVVEANNIIYWMGIDKFYSYSGRVDTVPCTVRQYVFNDINRVQSQLAFAGSNAQFNEVIWFYVSGSSNTIDRYVVYNYAENIWYYGQLNRTAWYDAGTTQKPIAASGGWLYDHESGTDNGQPLGAEPLPIESYIQSADVDIDDGDRFMLIRRVIPDVNFTGSETTNPISGQPIVPEVTMTVGVRNFPGAFSSTTNANNLTTEGDVETACAACTPTTAIIDQYTNQVFIRARGRQMNFRISSDTLGTQWQLGMPRVDARPDGTRG